MKKLCLTLALILALLPAANLAASAADGSGAEFPFTDVDESDYFREAVAWAYTNGVTTGTSKTTFSPEKTCTRCQVVTFLWRAMGEPEPNTYNYSPFMDVSLDAYYYKPVMWAVEQKITTGTSDWLFSPDQTCTYGHILTFLYRANGSPAAASTGLAESWADDLWYKNAVSWADGSLTGRFYDGELGSTGEGYPNGMLYESVFTAKLTDIKVLANGVYAATLCDQAIAKPQNTEEIIDGTLHVYTAPCGVETEIAQTFTFYAPGYEVARLPEEAREWLSMNLSVPKGTEKLPCWVAYDWESKDNVTFFGE